MPHRHRRERRPRLSGWRAGAARRRRPLSRAGLARRAVRRLAPDGGRRRDRLPLRRGLPREAISTSWPAPSIGRRSSQALAEEGFAPGSGVQPSPRAQAPLLRGSRRTPHRRLHGPDGHVPHARPASSAPALQPDSHARRPRPEQAPDRSSSPRRIARTRRRSSSGSRSPSATTRSTPGGSRK